MPRGCHCLASHTACEDTLQAIAMQDCCCSLHHSMTADKIVGTACCLIAIMLSMHAIMLFCPCNHAITLIALYAAWLLSCYACMLSCYPCMLSYYLRMLSCYLHMLSCYLRMLLCCLCMLICFSHFVVMLPRHTIALFMHAMVATLQQAVKHQACC